MAKAKRAHTAETLKPPSLGLRLRAPYFYPDSAYPFEGAGHWVQQEAPGKVNEALLRFLSDVQ